LHSESASASLSLSHFLFACHAREWSGTAHSACAWWCCYPTCHPLWVQSDPCKFNTSATVGTCPTLLSVVRDGQRSVDYLSPGHGPGRGKVRALSMADADAIVTNGTLAQYAGYPVLTSLSATAVVYTPIRGWCVVAFNDGHLIPSTRSLSTGSFNTSRQVTSRLCTSLMSFSFPLSLSLSLSPLQVRLCCPPLVDCFSCPDAFTDRCLQEARCRARQ
jgi:hypothetical protein